MAGFNIIEALRVLTPNLVFSAVLYPYRAAYHIARSTQSGLAFWRTFFKLTQLDIPEPTLSPADTFLDAGQIIKVKRELGYVAVAGTRGLMRILPLAENLLQIRVRQDETFPEPFSYGVIKPELEWTEVPFDLQETNSSAVLATGELRAVIDKHSNTLSLYHGNHQLLRTLVGGAGYQPETGEIRWSASFDSQTAFYGLGEKTGPVNQAGRRTELWNSDPAGYHRDTDPIYMNIPLLIALSHGTAVGLFFDNVYRTWLDLGTDMPGRVDYRAQGGEFRLYLAVGSPEQVMQRYTELTGRIPLPPLWAFGFHQSRWSYYPEARVQEIAEEFRRRHLPCDAIHLDIHYMNDYRCFTWDKGRFPNPKRMLDELHRLGFKVVTIIDPGIKVDSRYWVYREGIERNTFLKYPDGVRFRGPVWPGDCHFPDFTEPAVRDWWGGLYRGLLADGVDGFWNDMNEPALITTQQSSTIPGIVKFSHEGRGSIHREIHNVYGMQMVRASSEGVRRLRPNKRPYLMTRSGWAGVQRYANHWTGDNSSTWDHLRLSIQMVLTLGWSGIPITGPDIGGFTGRPTPELFARWIQAGALLPFFRVHSMIHSPDQEPWQFGPEVEAISQKYMELRYRLLPYIYTTAWQASQTGAPMVRALSYVYPHDSQTYNIDDEFLFGDSLLVAPVIKQGANERHVYLPEGHWYNFWTHSSISGGTTISISTPLDILPIFVRAGTVLPAWPVQQYVGERPIDVLTLNAYWGLGEYSSMLYEDDGLRPDYQITEAHRVSRFILQGGISPSRLSLRRKLEAGDFVAPISHTEVRLIGIEVQPSDIHVAGAYELESEIHSSTNEPVIRLAGLGSFDLTIH